MRLFYAIELDEKTRQLLLEKQNKLKPRAIKGNFSHGENLHLTLRFMGEVEEADFQVLKKILNDTAGKANGFRLSLSGAGVFERGYKSIVWWGIHKSDPLYRLQKMLEEEIRRNGFPAEAKGYHPHITLAREFVSDGNTKEFVSELHPLQHSFEVSGISLMESTRVDGKLTYISCCRAVLQ